MPSKDVWPRLESEDFLGRDGAAGHSAAPKKKAERHNQRKATNGIPESVSNKKNSPGRVSEDVSK